MDKPVLLVDMDGVLVDFVGGALPYFISDPVERERILNDWPRGVFYLPDVLGISKDAFWDTIEEGGTLFWAELEPYPWASYLVQRLSHYGRVVICSTPSRSPASVFGKMVWLRKWNVPGFFAGALNERDYVFTPRKDLLARPGTILIDDSPKNVEAFRKAGGEAYCFTRPWNVDDDAQARLTGWDVAKEIVEIVAETRS